MTADELDSVNDPGPRVVHIHRTVPRASRIYAVAAAFLAACAVIGLLATVGDRNGWRDVARDLQAENAALEDQIEEQSETSSCRSAAAFDSDEKASEVAIITALALAAVGRGESPAPFADQLEVAAADYRAAIDARAVALSTCATPTTPEAP